MLDVGFQVFNFMLDVAFQVFNVQKEDASCK